MKNSAQQSRKRVAEFRQRMKDAGLKQRSVYVHDKDWQRVKRYIDLLKLRRLAGR